MRFKSLGITLLFFSILTSPSLADPESTSMNTKVDHLLNYLGQTNRYSPLEGAGSHGSFGINLGVGFSAHPWKEANAFHREIFEKEELESNGNFQMPKLYVIKGTFLPVDVGVTFGQVLTTGVNQLSGHVHWAIFEALNLPSVGIRAHYSRLIGLKDSEFSSFGGDALAGFGFLRYFNIYAGYGLQQSTSHLEFSNEDSLALAETNSSSLVVEEDFQQTSYLGGLKITVLPPFFSATLEYQRNDTEFETYAAKLNMQI